MRVGVVADDNGKVRYELSKEVLDEVDVRGSRYSELSRTKSIDVAKCSKDQTRASGSAWYS